MPALLRVVLWNANGLLNHKLELQAFLDMHKIDIALISETHFTSRTVFKIPHYTTLYTPTTLPMGEQQSYFVAPYDTTNYHTTNLKLCRLQPSDSISVHAP